jgi:proline iminopeptidase
VDATIDGVRLYYQPVGPVSHHPLIVLHGGPGFDHTEMHPWLDPLGDMFRLIYMDERGQGRSQRVDPSTLTLQRFAADVTELAQALGLERYALLGHSFGAFIALAHAIQCGDASHYIISGGTASFTKTAREIQANLESFEPAALREQVAQSWALEPQARTADDVDHLWRMQAPFHFARTDTEAYRRYMAASDQAVYAPEVLAYFAAMEYPVEFEDQLRAITRPVLVITGDTDRTCTPRAARELHAGIRSSELVILPQAGHMTFVEQPGMYFAAVRDFFIRHTVASGR